MPKKKSVEQVIEETAAILRVWHENPEMQYHFITRQALQTQLDDLRESARSVELARAELAMRVDVTNTRVVELTNVITRTRAYIQAQYGSDSEQFEQAGGRRPKQRQRPGRT